MGAESFEVTYQGLTKEDALRGAIDEAAYESGHGGYTGTIAEKVGAGLVCIERYPEPLPDAQDGDALDERHRYARELLRDNDLRITDKWGPTGYIPLYRQPDGKIMFLFFGFASS